ncbi:helix-turn-helix domain-containing protein [Fictibacillus aquaticus]|uniref:helix-turn-helix domain-containing protein n=1 Tax=Fictibacillus aquaticus TaxID=2021314 RepID=UPI0030844473
MILDSRHVAEILKISRRVAYEVMEYKDFPLVRVGRQKRVSREAFFNWLNRSDLSPISAGDRYAAM